LAVIRSIPEETETHDTAHNTPFAAHYMIISRVLVLMTPFLDLVAVSWSHGELAPVSNPSPIYYLWSVGVEASPAIIVLQSATKTQLHGIW